MKIVNYSIISAIKLYQFFISPFFLSSCRYQPTCSEYFIDKKTRHKSWCLAEPRTSDHVPVRVLLD